MILDSITLCDVGAYAGKQTIQLTPPDNTRPIVLFGGLNGSGKTTLLDSLQICLFGQSAMCAKEKGIPYQSLLRRLINKKSRHQFSFIEVAFRRIANGENESYKVMREWKVVKNNIKETVFVYHNDRLDRVMSDNWSKYVEEFLPVNIANFFFFDGEKIEKYASPETAQKMIANAIHNLLDMDTVLRLRKDLLTVKSRRQVEDAPAQEHSMLLSVNEKLEALLSDIETLVMKRAEILTRNLEPTKREIDRLKADYQKKGGDLLDQKSKIEGRIASLQDEKKEIARKMHEMSGGVLPLALIKDTLTKVFDVSMADKEIRQARIVCTAIQKQNSALLDYIKANNVEKATAEKIANFLSKEFIEQNAMAGKETILTSSDNMIALTEQLVQTTILESVNQATDLINIYETIEEKLEHAETERSNIPDDSFVGEILGRINDLEQLASKHDEEISALTHEINVLKKHESKLAKEKDSLEAKIGDIALQKEKNKRFLVNIDKTHEVLLSFEKAVIHHHIKRIEELVLESYHHLLHKTNLISKIIIDPDTFSITVRDYDNKTLSADQLSAGERQLLSIALLWGLAKASGRPLPIAIDTPMGRLDSEHRARLIERYFPYASHQVLLFSTDEEIVGNYHAKLSKRIGKSYQIVHDDETSTTSIIEGYFHVNN